MSRICYLLCIWFVLLPAVGRASPHQPRQLSFVANKSQWPTAVLFRAELPGGEVYLTRSGLVYDWHSPADLARLHPAGASLKGSVSKAAPVRSHAVYVDFVGAAGGKAVGRQQARAYHNYFLGPDQSKWAARVPLFAEVQYQSLYPGINLHLYGTDGGRLKYDLEVTPGARATAIALRYRGADAVRLLPNGALLVQTSVGAITEQQPYAYQPTPDGQRQAVPCRYTLRGNILSYEFPQGYDQRRMLIIDPVVAAATYSGATGSFLYGQTAGYDAVGNVLVAARTTGFGYPVTPGAYQTSPRQLGDVGLSKFNRTGSALLFATYLGGSNLDDARSLRTTTNGDIYLFVKTGSTNFPTTPGCYDASFNGLLDDLAVCRLSSNGSQLLASTYLGGPGEENPADFVLSTTGSVFLTGSTAAGFPTTTGAYDRTANGFQDGFVAQLNGTLTTLVWSTLLGGSLDDEPAAIQLSGGTEPVVAGATASTNFPTTSGAFVPTVRFSGDGFISRLNATGTVLVASTAFGSANAADDIRFLALDGASNVYAYGTTEGALTATPGALTNGVGKVFISKLPPDLRNQTFTALVPPYQVGSGLFNGLTAFGLDDCGKIRGAAVTTTTGLPQVNALAGSTGTGALYTFALDANATQVEFGSYYGPPAGIGQEGVHVHSFTQRFDAQGRLYHAFCVPDDKVFPTTPLAYARTARNSGFDVVGLKVVPDAANVLVQALSVGTTVERCAPLLVQLDNNSTGAVSYRWDFGDGSAPATTSSTTHTFTQPGSYRVRLTITGAAQACAPAVQDTASVIVRVNALPVSTLPASLRLCTAAPVTLDAGNPGSAYRWSTGAITRTISVTSPGIYRVEISNGACTTTSQTQVLGPISTDAAQQDTTSCAGSVELMLTAEPGSRFLWSTGETTSSITVTQSGSYSAEVSLDGCTQRLVRNVTIGSQTAPPNIITPNGDGMNDRFAPAPVEAGTRLRIFNRWGRLVYSSAAYGNDWAAADQPAGVYYYLLENERFCFRRVKGWLEVVK
ncbi:gliding motility-associated C-terminal domain-containing protein [Hymenobacter sp. BT175]|uniref:DUF7948 domain-containing protein n=1 Tax=Hymenobacter translucens TaxID=2886507 RepID=UPI001D0DD6BA|nr:gliding motility-associated C-terminal domain-containing protein [Hymenobacter translucens]MCC2545712.1 gliding motility-associated C-terminal domain-containing protein [Hymenobacter translucens]